LEFKDTTNVSKGGTAVNLEKIQHALREKELGGWLFYDFHNRDLMAYHILGMDAAKMTSRRWFYFIPAKGEPKKLVSSVEKFKLDSLPGSKQVYLAWTQQHTLLKKMLGKPKRIAMQYSPKNNIPYVSIVDAGTMELVKSFGHKVVSSADLVQMFEAIIDEPGFQSHLEAGRIVDQIRAQAFEEIAKAIRERRSINEYEIAQLILSKFAENGLTTDNSMPIVGVNEHPADPHFEPTPQNAHVVKNGDTLLIDLWAKKKAVGSIYYDITWCGYVGNNPPPKYVQIFNVVCNARNAAVNFIQDKFSKGEKCYGWQVDDVCRNVVKRAGYGKHFVHRTGHSIGEEVHGNGVNIDNLETKDERPIVPGVCFSIEPGIYLEGEMAVRTEINVFVTQKGEVLVTGEKQNELVLLV
jgi:Xaa-Pro aminopeptidase